MPQMNKGGKFIFGWSVIQKGGIVHFPDRAVEEYGLSKEETVYIMTGSKQTGGFCVTRRQLLETSKLSHILSDNKGLEEQTVEAGIMIPYKGRKYGWLPICEGSIIIPAPMRKELHLEQGDRLLSIRSSDIAFTMGAKGKLLDRAYAYQGTIEEY